MMDEIIENVKVFPGVEWSDYDIQVETSLYESALKPLENVSKISTFLIIFLLTAVQWKIRKKWVFGE